MMTRWSICAHHWKTLIDPDAEWWVAKSDYNHQQKLINSGLMWAKSVFGTEYEYKYYLGLDFEW